MACAVFSTGFEKDSRFDDERAYPCSAVKIVLRDKIWQLYCGGCADFYVDCEWGIPLWAAEMICALKMYNDIKLHIVLPCAGHADGWSGSRKARYFRVLRTADTVSVQEDACREKAAKLMIDMSDDLLIFRHRESGRYFFDDYTGAKPSRRKIIDFIGLC